MPDYSMLTLVTGVKKEYILVV